MKEQGWVWVENLRFVRQILRKSLMSPPKLMLRPKFLNFFKNSKNQKKNPNVRHNLGNSLLSSPKQTHGYFFLKINFMVKFLNFWTKNLKRASYSEKQFTVFASKLTHKSPMANPVPKSKFEGESANHT